MVKEVQGKPAVQPVKAPAVKGKSALKDPVPALIGKNRGKNAAALAKFNPKAAAVPRSNGFMLVYKIGPGFKTISISYEPSTYKDNFLLQSA